MADETKVTETDLSDEQRQKIIESGLKRLNNRAEKVSKVTKTFNEAYERTSKGDGTQDPAQFLADLEVIQNGLPGEKKATKEKRVKSLLSDLKTKLKKSS